MEEDIKVLEEELANIRNLIEYYTFESLDYDKKFRMERFEKAIENLIKGYKELEEKAYKKEYYEEVADELYKNSIPKSIIKARIEKLKVLAEKADDETLNACELDIRKNQIYLLKSLLQEGDTNETKM